MGSPPLQVWGRGGGSSSPSSLARALHISPLIHVFSIYSTLFKCPVWGCHKNVRPCQLPVSKNILVCSTWSSVEGRLMETARRRLAPKPAQRPPLFVSPGHERRRQSRTPSKNELMSGPLSSRAASSFPPRDQLGLPAKPRWRSSASPSDLPGEQGGSPRRPRCLPVGRLRSQGAEGA